MSGFIENEADSLRRQFDVFDRAFKERQMADRALLQSLTDLWGDLRFAGDYNTADKLRDILRAHGFEPKMGTKYYTDFDQVPKALIGNPVGNTVRRI